MDFNPVAATTHSVYSDNPTRPVNGLLKKTSLAIAPPPPSMVFSASYKECLKNHAAAIGGHALDGCGEFMPSHTSNPAEPRSLKCAACGCHRNFHRRDSQQEQPHFLNFFYSPPPRVLPHRRFSPSTSPSPSSSPMSSPSPPPLSHFPPPSLFHPSEIAVHHMFFAPGTSNSGPSEEQNWRFNSPAATKTLEKENPSRKKRCRTNFSPQQKQKMYAFSEKLGWKMPKADDGLLVQEFCDEIGASRGVFKVWMHNHKISFRSKRSESGDNNNNNNATEKVNEDENNSNKDPVARCFNGGRVEDLHAASVN